jgi:hypothetical protein
MSWRVKVDVVATWLAGLLAGREDAGGGYVASRPVFVENHHADPALGITKVTVAVFFDFTVKVNPYTPAYETDLHRFLTGPTLASAMLESQDTHTSPPDGALRVRQAATGTTATAFPSDTTHGATTAPAPPYGVLAAAIVAGSIHQTTGVTAPSAMGAPSTSAPQRSSKVAKLPAGVLKDRLNVKAGTADFEDVVKAGVLVKKAVNDTISEGGHVGGEGVRRLVL